MDLRQLETFIEVANLKSFSRAAEKLFITQPTVTNHIQSLEKELGSLLINRSGKKISLTEAGSLFYKYAINIVNSCEMAKFDLAAYKGSIQGHLHIYSSSVPRKYILPNIIDSFLKSYPEVTFTLEDKDSKNVVKSILEGDTDFGIVGAKYPSNRLNYIELMEDKLLAITPNTSLYPKPNYSYLTLDEIINGRIIFREEGSGTRNLLVNRLEEGNINIDELDIIAYVEDTETIKELVSLGVGISFLSQRAVTDDIRLGKYKVYYMKEVDFNRKFYFVYHNKRQLSPLNETFKDFVLEYIKNHTI
ncbi:Transcriptional regulator, LysR family [[Clostridium] ultunense Esp]|uniref:Transcriptional regulator, LysR family n=1 Tax=[Clostridium] ultunense Esp TaxID=1288971 RepID=M1YUY3_9FIRM|nr:selenium metabolism-associated LysR family transcriptional regulator [Schnuerera ultunensis]CCQ94360.1 Transcriptional regulator, LysR family [[Clostridium] ultunense Esp]SHD78509.1 Transcriptional regulator, LysR family [[Clostridium] ultunense Esp]